MIDEEEEESFALHPRIVEMHGSYGHTKGELAALLHTRLATSSGQHPTYRSCSSGEEDWKGREDHLAVCRMAVRRHIEEETELREKANGHERSPPTVQFDMFRHQLQREPGGDQKEKREEEKHAGEKNEEAAVRCKEVAKERVEVVVMHAGEGADALKASGGMSISGELEGKLQPTPTERTLTPLR
jgi:hypothetical protein